MNDELCDAIRRLQGRDEVQAQMAFAEAVELARREPEECAAGLSDALLAELAAGPLRTPRLLTLLGLTHAPAPACVPVCLDLLRRLASASPPPVDAALGAAAIVACTQPRALLPDMEALQAGVQTGPEIDRMILRALPLLLAVSSRILGEYPDSAMADMARWLWCDCAMLDLMSLMDFAGLQVEQSGPDDPIVHLMVDLIERVPASEDQKRYAGQRLQEAGAGAAAEAQLKSAWRAIRVAPAEDPTAGRPGPVVDPEPPLPEPGIDNWLALFAEGNAEEVELARASIDQMFEDVRPPAVLAWWAAVSVDALPSRRRRAEIEWVLVQIGTTLRRHGKALAALPPSLLCRWLDMPQLLDVRSTLVALDLLSRQRPDLIVERYLHRAVGVSSERQAEVLAGGMWGALAAAEPAAVLLVASRWIAFGFGQSEFLVLLLDLLAKQVREQPALIERLSHRLAPGMPTSVLNAAQAVLEQLRQLPRRD